MKNSVVVKGIELGLVFVPSDGFGLDDNFLIGSEGDEDAVQVPEGTLFLEAFGDDEEDDDLLTSYLEETVYYVEPNGHWVVGLASRGEFSIEDEGQAESLQEGIQVLVGELQHAIDKNESGEHE